VVPTRQRVLDDLARAGRLVEARVHPGGDFDGWPGRDVLCHLAAYVRLVGAIMRAVTEGRAATEPELYGRELSDADRAIGNLDEVNEALRKEYAGLSYEEAVALWRAMHAEALAQCARLSDAQLAAPGPDQPAHWRRPQLADVVSALVHHYEGHMSGAA
jgi:DinB superfamily